MWYVGKKYKYVNIDKCLIHEIINLWEQGIKTTGCCCGHGDSNKAYHWHSACSYADEEYNPSARRPVCRPRGNPL